MQQSLAAVLLAMASLPLGAQSFEAAFVKPSKEIGFSFAGGPGTSDPGQITYTNITLRDLVVQAYSLQPYQFQGAAWLQSGRFTVVAKVPAGASREDLRVMLQRLLAERFKLAVHRETHEGRNYRLVVDKGGSKLQPPTGGTPEESATLSFDGNGAPRIPGDALGRPVTLAGKHLVLMFGSGMVMIMAHSQPMSELAGALNRLLDGPLSDATGLAGVYDFTLNFAMPAESRLPPMGMPGEPILSNANAEPLPGLFQEVREKLGLRVEASRGPVEVLVVDHAEKVPTEN